MRRFAGSLVVVLTSLAPAARAQDSAPAAAPAAEAAAAENVVDVVTRSGARFRGVVVKQDERTVYLRSASGVVRELPRTAVARIEAPREPPAAPVIPAAPVDDASGAAPAPATGAPAAQAPLAAEPALGA